MARPLICDGCGTAPAVTVITMTETGDVFAFCGPDMVAGLAALLGQLTGLDVARALDNERNNRADDDYREQLQAVRDGGVDVQDDAQGDDDLAAADDTEAALEVGSDELSAVEADLMAAFAAAVAAAVEAGMSEDVAAQFVGEAFEAGVNPFDQLAQLAALQADYEAGDDDQDGDDDDDEPSAAAEIGELLTEHLPADDDDVSTHVVSSA